MAIDVDNLDIILRVIGLRTFQAQMGEARASVASVGKQAIASDEAMAASSKKSMTRMAMLRKVSLGVAGAVAATAYEGYKLSLNYQRQIEMIHADAGLSQKDTDMMYKSILEMSRKFPQGPIAFSKGAYHMASVTHNAQKSLDGLRASAQLATVGNSDLESTTSAVAAVWRASAEEGLSFSHIVKILNATVGAGNMRMQDLVAALGTGVLPVFKTGGVTLEDFGASLALLTDEGQHADNAATHLRMTLTLLAAPSKIAKKHLHEIGLGALDLADALREKGLTGALDLLRQKLYKKFPGAPVDPKTLTAIAMGDPTAAHALGHAASQRMNVLARAFGGARSGATIMALVDNLESLRQKENQVRTTQKNWGDSLAKTMGLPAIKLHTAVSNLQVDLIDFGDTIRGPVTDALLGILWAADQFVRALGHMKDVIKWLSDNIPGFSGATKMAAEAVGIFVAVTLTWYAAARVAAAMNAIYAATWVGLSDAIELATIAMYVFMVENPELLAFALLAAALIMIIFHWKQFKHTVMDVWHWIKAHWYALIPIFLALMGPMGIVAAYMITHWKKVRHAGSEAAHYIADRWRDFIRFFERIGHKVSSIGQKIWSVYKWTPMGLQARATGAILKHIPFLHHAEGGVMPWTGWTGINETAAGESIYLPRGTSIQPSPASSLAVPRSHVPNPAPRPDLSDRPLYIENVIKLDRKVLYRGVSRAKADDKARRGGP